MPFPTTFPLADIGVLMDFFKNRTAHSVQDYLQAAYDVGGYALAQLIAAPAQVKVVAACPSTPDAKLKCLELCREQCTAVHDSANKVGSVGGINWLTVWSVVQTIVQELIPLLA